MLVLHEVNFFLHLSKYQWFPEVGIFHIQSEQLFNSHCDRATSYSLFPRSLPDFISQLSSFLHSCELMKLQYLLKLIDSGTSVTM